MNQTTIISVALGRTRLDIHDLETEPSTPHVLVSEIHELEN